MNNTVGKSIHMLREKAGFTQKNIADYLNVDQSMISKVEKGDRAMSADMIEKISYLFGVTVEQIEDGNVSASNLSFAFRGSNLSVSDMEAISAINRIALNSEFMDNLLKEDKK